MREFHVQDQPLTWRLEFNVVDKKGAWFSYKGQRLGQGREAVRGEQKEP